MILPEELSLLQPEEDRDLLTLLTCTPYAVNTHRLLVRGTRVPYVESAVQDHVDRARADRSWLEEYIHAIVLGVLLLIILGTAAFLIWRRKRKKAGRRPAGRRRRRRR